MPTESILCWLTLKNHPVEENKATGETDFLDFSANTPGYILKFSCLKCQMIGFAETKNNIWCLILIWGLEAFVETWCLILFTDGIHLLGLS